MLVGNALLCFLEWGLQHCNTLWNMLLTPSWVVYFLCSGVRGVSPLDRLQKQFWAYICKIGEISWLWGFWKMTSYMGVTYGVIGFCPNGDPFWSNVILWGSQGVSMKRRPLCEHNPLFGLSYDAMLQELWEFVWKRVCLVTWPGNLLWCHICTLVVRFFLLLSVVWQSCSSS